MFIEELLFDIADALLIPVLVASLIVLAIAVVEVGALVGELWRRRERGPALLARTTERLQHELAAGDDQAAQTTAATIAWSESMRTAMVEIVSQRGREGAEANVSKALSDFEYRSLKRLERTRILVRFGPALGLMGTLIPLSPALAGLAAGDFETLTENLRVAFSVTVSGLLVGAIAFGVSLVRDRLYGQDYSDAEYVATRTMPYIDTAPKRPDANHQVIPAHAHATAQGQVIP